MSETMVTLSGGKISTPEDANEYLCEPWRVYKGGCVVTTESGRRVCSAADPLAAVSIVLEHNLALWVRLAAKRRPDPTACGMN
jgi:hypothetical protein